MYVQWLEVLLKLVKIHYKFIECAQVINIYKLNSFLVIYTLLRIRKKIYKK